MDFLCKRYGGSFFILDRYIEQCRFTEFIYEVMNIKNEEELYELWLYKVQDKSYEEFKELVIPPKRIREDEVISIVNESANILDSFIVEE